MPGVQAVAPGVEGYAQLVGRDGKPIGVAANGPPTLGVAWTDIAALNPLRMPSRRAARLDVLHAVTTE